MARCVGQKNLFCNQNFKNDKIYSKFAEIWSEFLPSCPMLIQGSFGQYLEWIRPFSPFQCSSQPRLQDLHPSSANVCAGPIVVLHMSEHVFFPIGLRQKILKNNFDSHKASLSLKWCHVTWSLSGQFTVFTDLPQLYECLLILQFFISLLQVIYNPLSSLQFLSQRFDLRFLFLDDLFQL